MRVAVLALAFGSAAAFLPSTSSPARSVAVFETKADLEALAMELNPVVGFYDPMNLAEGNFWNEGNEATIGFLRHSEIKHGRVAMAAFVGFTLAANGVHFPWTPIGGAGAADSTNPPELWDSIPLNAKLQIVGFIGLLEWWSELGERVGQPAHYMRGGKPGAFPPFKGAEVSIAPHVMPLGSLYDPLGFSKNKSEVKNNITCTHVTHRHKGSTHTPSLAGTSDFLDAFVLA